jgi:hypothetical protein
MGASRAARLVETSLRCYPARWRRRHGAEAAELAALLIRDGTPASSIAVSYLAGAAREWPGAAREWLRTRASRHPSWRPSRRLSAVACALLVAACSLGVSGGLLALTVPARAASTTHPGVGTRCPPPDVTQPRGNQQMIIWEAGHGRSC